MKFYAYCLSDEVEAGAVEEAPGVAGARPRLFCCGAITAVVSETGDEPVTVTRENVFAHERVIRQVLAKTTPLPFRFGTIASEAELESYIETRNREIESLLARVRGAVEMGVKIIWDREAARKAVVEYDELTSARGEDYQRAGPGRAFLLARRRELAEEDILKKQAESIAGWLENKLNSVVRETIVSVRPADGLVIVAAHLVERAQIGEYRERLSHIRRERGDLRFLTSGAWPPYSFVHIRA